VSKKALIDVPQPPVVNSYNCHMGGINGKLPANISIEEMVVATLSKHSLQNVRSLSESGR